MTLHLTNIKSIMNSFEVKSQNMRIDRSISQDNIPDH